MLSILGNIFGTGEVVKKGLELIRILLKYPKLAIFMVIGLFHIIQFNYRRFLNRT